MAYTEPSDALIQTLLTGARTIAVVGLSNNPARPSYDVAAYLQRNGYKIVPITPKTGLILGEQSYPDLLAVPFEIDIVNIFRRPELVGPHVDEAVEVDAKAVWLQLGIRNDEAVAPASGVGVDVIQDRCIKIEHMRLRRSA